MLVGETGKPQYPPENGVLRGKNLVFRGEGNRSIRGKKEKNVAWNNIEILTKNENFGKFLIFQVIVARLTKKKQRIFTWLCFPPHLIAESLATSSPGAAKKLHCCA